MLEKVYEMKCGVFCIVGIHVFLLPSVKANNNPYKYHIQINRREREFLHTTHPIVREKTVAATQKTNERKEEKKLMAIINLLLHFE